MSTRKIGKNKRCSVLKFLDIRDEPDNLTDRVFCKKDSELKDVDMNVDCVLPSCLLTRFFSANICLYVTIFIKNKRRIRDMSTGKIGKNKR